MAEIVQVSTPEEINEARDIFREYETWIGVSLCFQGFEEELKSLPGKYSPPNGRLLLAYIDGAVAGCVAFRKMDDEACELKRLFVREQFQGTGLGRQLLDRIIADARSAGYKFMRLDSWKPKMGRAIDMYRTHGFTEIDRYNDNPYDMIFMELSL